MTCRTRSPPLSRTQPSHHTEQWRPLLISIPQSDTSTYLFLRRVLHLPSTLNERKRFLARRRVHGALRLQCLHRNLALNRHCHRLRSCESLLPPAPTRRLVQERVHQQTVVALLLTLHLHRLEHFLSFDRTELSLDFGSNTLCHGSQQKQYETTKWMVKGVAAKTRSSPFSPSFCFFGQYSS